MDDERQKMDAYLGKGIKKVASESSLLTSSSRWLNDPTMREIIPVWLLRKNGPDFPVEADHTLGLSSAMQRIQPDEEINALMEEERKINPAFDAWLKEGFVSTYRNEDFDHYAPGTVGGIMGYQIRECGFDLTLGVDWATAPRPTTPLAYWRLRGRQSHDFEHIITGGQFNSIGELVVIFSRLVNNATHFSPKLASALNAYLIFTGFRMISRSLLHYPETWLKAIECVEQGIKVGRASAPIWAYKFEDVFHLTPEEARIKLGVCEALVVESERASAIFREEPLPLAEAAE